MRFLQPKNVIELPFLLWAALGSLGNVSRLAGTFQPAGVLGTLAALPAVSTETSIRMADQPSASSSYTGDSSEEDDALQSDEGQDREDGDEDVINVDLEFFDPSEIDYHGLKMLLRSLLDADDFPGCTDLVEAIIRQVCIFSRWSSSEPMSWVELSRLNVQRSVGTVVKTAETDDPIGVATVLNLSRHSTLRGLQDLKAFLLNHCPTKELQAGLNEV